MFIIVKFGLPDIQSIAFGCDGVINSDSVASPWKLKEKYGTADVKIASDRGEKVVQLKLIMPLSRWKEGCGGYQALPGSRAAEMEGFQT